MKALLGRKIGMSQTFTEAGEAVPVTLVLALPNKITLQRDEARDGYAAVQVGLPKHEGATDFARQREFATSVEEGTTELSVTQFEAGDIVTVTGVSKGKGFQGVVKRHHFKGGPKSHGHRHVLRRPGSIGGRFPQHVMKGMRMAGRMGGDQVTVKNLEVVAIDEAKNLLILKGAIPGKRNSIVEIKQAA